MAELVFESISKRLGSTQAVADLSLTVEDGGFIVLLGPTGAGKTTTLRLAVGLERPDTGVIRIAGQDATGLSPAERDVVFVFQQYSLYPHMTVFDNLAFPLRAPCRDLSAATIRRRVGEVAELLRIDSKLDQKVTRLSGGQMQRVAIGRALVRSPRVYMMDEPLSSLDAKLRSDLRIELKRIQIELGATMLYVTHDQTEALTLASKIGVMSEGRLVQVGAPRDIYENPANTYVAARLGSPPINIVPRRLFPDAPAPSAASQIGFRTEHIHITPRSSGAPAGRITWVEHLGDQDHLHLQLEDVTLVTTADPDAHYAPGDEVSFALSSPFFFDAAGDRVRA